MNFLHKIQFKTKKYDLFEKNKKKSNFFDFFFQNGYWLVVFDCKFFKFLVRNFKTELLYALKGYENKSHQRRAHYLKPRRNGRPIPTGGALGAPPPLTRVKLHCGQRIETYLVNEYTLHQFPVTICQRHGGNFSWQVQTHWYTSNLASHYEKRMTMACAGLDWTEVIQWSENLKKFWFAKS